MISRIRGLVREVGEAQVLLEVSGIGYEVFLPPSILRAVSDRVEPSGELELVTFHYYQQHDKGRGIPILIGFLNEIEREFFERFISVSGVGPKAALKAMTLPIPAIAQAIDEGDLSLLRSLPGIGEQRAKEIVAKLQGKVGKYALMPSKERPSHVAEAGHDALEDEAIAILVQLEYKKAEAKQMIHAALERHPKIKTSEELLNAVYRQQRQTNEPGHAATKHAGNETRTERRSVRAAEPAPIGQ